MKQEKFTRVLHGGEEIPTGGWRGGEEIPTGGWRESTVVESDNYRTKDGEAHFAFSFFQEDEFVEVDVTFAPMRIKLEESPTMCVESKRGGYTIVTSQKARDVFTARLIAGEWAENIWSNNIEDSEDID